MGWLIFIEFIRGRKLTWSKMYTRGRLYRQTLSHERPFMFVRRSRSQASINSISFVWNLHLPTKKIFKYLFLIVTIILLNKCEKFKEIYTPVMTRCIEGRARLFIHTVYDVSDFRISFIFKFLTTKNDSGKIKPCYLTLTISLFLINSK